MEARDTIGMANQTRHDGLRAALPAIGGVVLLIVVAAVWAGFQEPGEPRRADGARITPSKTDVADRPNVVIFLIDTLRADRLGVYGYDRRPTSPRIDTLARESVVFEQACAPSPWTLPTVVSLVTSTFPCEHGTLDNRQQLSRSLEPLAERFQRLGYTTLGSYANPFAGPDYGLDRGYDVLRSARKTDGKQVGRLLDEQPDRPFFLYIHNLEPHSPLVFAPAHTDGFRDVPRLTRNKIRTHYTLYRRATRVDFAEDRPLGTTDNTSRQDRYMAALTSMLDDYNELYDASVRLADERVSLVIDELKRRGLWDNTLFIVLSDHGEEMNEHGGWLHDQSVYEELVHVPLVVRFPSGQYAGRKLHTVVSLVDVLPTIFDFLETPEAARGARGRSLMPLIRGDESAADEFIVPAMRWNTKKYYRPWKESRGDINVVVRRGKWKGIWNVEPKTLELYNLTGDPGERHDISAATPKLAADMLLFAQAWFEECGTNAVEPPAKNADPDEETLQKLRSLGYID